MKGLFVGVLETTNEMVAEPRVALGIAGYEPTVMLFHYPAIEFLRLVTRTWTFNQRTAKTNK